MLFRSAANEAAAPVPIDERSAALAKSLHILLVEDNSGVRETTTDQLEDLGNRVTACNSAAAAIALLESDRSFDLVFSDVVMPGGQSGFDLAKWVRAHRPELPVLLTSGFTEELARQGATDAPNFPLLRKPYGKSELLEALRKVLEGVAG